MKDFYFREPSGKIVMTGYCHEDDLDMQTFPNAVLEVGKADLQLNYYKDGNLVNYPIKPNDNCIFDFTTETWVLDYDKAEKKALEQRDILLAEGPDRISPMWWASMTEQEQMAWTQYRQDLLDITKQVDYPEFIVWPIKP